MESVAVDLNLQTVERSTEQSIEIARSPAGCRHGAIPWRHAGIAR
jgi:hypothetical protein